MKLKYKFDSIDEIPSAYHDLYTDTGSGYILTGVEGIKTDDDVSRLKSALEKERNDHKRLRERFRPLDGREIESVISDLDRIEEYKLAAEGKFDESKINELVETRLKSRTSPLERERDRLQKQLSEYQEIISRFEEEKRVRTIHDSVRSALSRSKGFVQNAADDVLMYAERMLEIDDRGNVVTKDSVGVTPGIDAAVWLTEMQQKKPYWWGDSVGAGTAGGRATTGATGNNPWRKETWNMTEQMRLYRDNPERAAQLAKSAGVTL